MKKLKCYKMRRLVLLVIVAAACLLCVCLSND
jgi:hypothetical protein